MKEYPGAGHSFLNDAENAPRLLRPLTRISGIGPEPESAADAWRRIEGFFAEHLVELVTTSRGGLPRRPTHPVACKPSGRTPEGAVQDRRGQPPRQPAWCPSADEDCGQPRARTPSA